MNINEWELIINNIYFKNHKATLTYDGSFVILNWKEENSTKNMVRYVFDGQYLYITGDLGEAVFKLTWNAEIDSFNDVNIYYFVDKLKTFSHNVFEFNSQYAKEALMNWKRELIKDLFNYGENKEAYNFGAEYNEFSIIIDSLAYRASICSDKEEWTNILNIPVYKKFFAEYGNGDDIWLVNVGDIPNTRLYAYLIGLKMASKQFRNER